MNGGFWRRVETALALCGALVAVLPAPVSAQAPVPPPATPVAPPVPAATAPAPSAAAAVATAANRGQPARAPDRFFVAAYDVIGVTRLLPETIENAVYPFTGPDRSGKDVEAASKAVQAAYAKAGYEAVVVEIPPQDTATFRQGLVQIRVDEAPVGRIAVLGNRHHSAKRVLAEVPSVKPGEPLDLKALQTDLAAANRFPDRVVTPEFKPGTTPGTVDVDLKVQDKLPLHASLEINNDHSPSTEPLRLTGTARDTDLWGLGHTLSASFVVAPQAPNESTVFSGSYLAPFIGTPWSILLYGYTSNSNVAALGGTQVLGNGYQIGLRAIYKLPVASTNQSISFGFDFKHFNQNILVGAAQASTTPITYIPVVGEYTIAGQGAHSQFDVTFGLTAGLRAIRKVSGYDTTSPGCSVLDPCAIDQFDNKALHAIENFVHGNITANAQFASKADFVLKLGLSAQLADSHLVSNEQFGVGGLASVRGYLQSEAVADDGVSGQIELQSPSLAPHLASFVDELRFYAFLDGGDLWLIGPVLAGQTSRYSLLSAGGGMRTRLFDHVFGDVLGGVPLLDGPVTHAFSPRVTFQVKSEF